MPTCGQLLSSAHRDLHQQGILEAKNGGTLFVNGTWTNSSTIGDGLDPLAEWNLEQHGHHQCHQFDHEPGRLIHGPNLGTFNRTTGTVNLTGTLDNTGTTLALNATTGSWNLVGGTLKNGTLSETGGAKLVGTASGGTLDGVTLNGDLDLSQQSGVNLTVRNNLVLNGTMSLGNADGSTYGYVYFGDYASPSRRFSGNATVLYGGSGSNRSTTTATTTGREPR